MKNYFESRGQAFRLIFDPSTDEFRVETEVHPFSEMQQQAAVTRSAVVSQLVDRRPPVKKPVAEKLKRRVG